MRLLLLTAYFPPENGSASHLFHNMGREFVRRGHEVVVLTGFPTYHVDEETLDRKYRKGLWMREAVEGMTVVRARLFNVPRAVPVLRGLQQVSAAFVYIWSGLFLAGRSPDIILIYSPPLFLGLTGLVLRLATRARIVINVQDLFPQTAIDLGVLRNPLLIRLLRAVEAGIYRRADAVTVHSPGNREHVVRHGGSEAKTSIVPNVVDTETLRPGPRMNAFRRQHAIPEDEIVVSFAGVLGYSQDLDTVIEAAQRLTRIPNLRVYIVGDGIEKGRLVAKAAGAENVRFMPMLPKDQYAELLHASDICLATLRAQVKTPVVPSKILSIMAAGRPLITAMPLEGDAPFIVHDAACGMCVPPEDPGALAESIADLAADRGKRDAMGTAGRAYVERNYSLSICAELYETIFAGMRPQRITPSEERS